MDLGKPFRDTWASISSIIFGQKERVHDGSGKERQDTDPVANAMFNEVGKVAIYGGRFVQNITVKSDKRTWTASST
jgi:hypothetical protein